MSKLSSFSVLFLTGIFLGVAQVLALQGTSTSTEDPVGQNTTLDTTDDEANLWKISEYVKYPDWFAYFDNISNVDSTTSSYFVDAGVADKISKFGPSKGVWVAFTTHNLPFPEPEKVFPTITFFSSVGIYNFLQMKYFLSGVNASILVHHSPNESARIPVNDAATDWETFEVYVTVQELKIELRCNEHKEDEKMQEIILIDSITLFQGPPATRPSPFTTKATTEIELTTETTRTPPTTTMRTSTTPRSTSTTRKPGGQNSGGANIKGLIPGYFLLLLFFVFARC